MTHVLNECESGMIMRGENIIYGLTNVNHFLKGVCCIEVRVDAVRVDAVRVDAVRVDIENRGFFEMGEIDVDFK